MSLDRRLLYLKHVICQLDRIVESNQGIKRSQIYLHAQTSRLKMFDCRELHQYVNAYSRLICTNVQITSVYKFASLMLHCLTAYTLVVVCLRTRISLTELISGWWGGGGVNTWVHTNLGDILLKISAYDVVSRESS